MARLEIKEGTDQYSLFRAFTVLMLFITCFGVVWGVHETKINRHTGLHNRAVTCAALKGEMLRLESHEISDEFLTQAFTNECINSPIESLYPNAAK